MLPLDHAERTNARQLFLWYQGDAPSLESTAPTETPDARPPWAHILKVAPEGWRQAPASRGGVHRRSRSEAKPRRGGATAVNLRKLFGAVAPARWGSAPRSRNHPSPWRAGGGGEDAKQTNAIYGAKKHPPRVSHLWRVSVVGLC